MRLVSIRLHPFGHFVDESRDLSASLVVIHGPNELGKTTLRQAIFHALFTPTDLTKQPFENTLKPWLPASGGDHAQVTLTFEHGGSTWTLQKRWGAGQASTLSDGTTSISASGTVQARLAEMLVHDEATYRYVLFTGQAELERTLDSIDKNAATIRDVGDLLKAGAADDVDEQQLRRVLEKKIDDAFGRWDDERGRPARQAGKEKGLDDPWQKGAGAIVKAWYAWQGAVAECDDVLAIERQIDDVTGQVAEDERRIAAAAAFVARHGHLREDLQQRAILCERLTRLDAEVASLGEIYGGWPTAQATIDQWTTRQSELETQRDKLQEELANATKRRDGSATRAAFSRLEAAKTAWEQAQADAQKLPDPGEERVAAVRRLQDEITAAENKLAARQLAWRIEAAEPGEARIERGTEPPQTVVLGPSPESGTAEARVRIVARGLTLTVDSGGDDVDALFTTLAADRQRLAEALQACHATTPTDLALMAERRRTAEAAAKERKASYEGALGGQTFEQWSEAIEALDALPATRDVAVLEQELETIRGRLATGQTQVDKHRESVDGWIQTYTNRDLLEEKLLDAKSTLRQARNTLAELATLPGEFESPQALLANLDDAQREQLAAQERLTDTKAALATLTSQLDDRRSQDLAEQAEAAKRAFERARVEGRAYRRILEELDRITAVAADDPLEAFADKVTGLFSRITGGTARLEFDGQLPARVVRENVALPPERLSQGGGGALGLAVRLAMAEAYTAHGGGFVMLDDPFVQFDAVRMAAAADIVREFSEHVQVIFFTCHDHHAERLGRGDRTAGSVANGNVPRSAGVPTA